MIQRRGTATPIREKEVNHVLVDIATTKVKGCEKADQKVGESKDPQAMKPLLAVLKDEDSSVQDAAAEVLGKIGDGRAVQPLVAALKDQDSSVWELEARALGKIGDSRAIDPLVAALNDKKSYVQNAAHEAIRKITATYKWLENACTECRKAHRAVLKRTRLYCRLN